MDKDGLVFVVRPQPRTDSPLDVDGVDLGLTVEEIVQFVQEGRDPARRAHPTEGPTEYRPRRTPG